MFERKEKFNCPLAKCICAKQCEIIQNCCSCPLLDKREITDRVKTFEDACHILGLNPCKLPEVDCMPVKHRKSIIAYYKLVIIASALNEGWEPDFTNCNEWKYWNWFYVEAAGAHAGFAAATTYRTASYTNANFGSRLCFKTRELATYAREQFLDLYFEYLFIEMPKNYGK